MEVDIMATGKVRHVNLEKTCGSIVPDQGGPDVSMDSTAIRGNSLLEDDSLVEFDVKTDPETGNPAATNIRILP